MRPLSTFILLLLVSCANSIQNKSVNCEEQIKEGMIEHTITYTRRGSRSESRHGHLIIRGKELPDVFTLVKCGNNFYKFYQRENLWGNDGYFPIKASEAGISIKKSERQISGNNLTRGWYKGDEMRVKTPSTWLYVIWKRGRAFVSPRNIEAMISELRIKNIPRLKIFPIKTKKRQ